MPKSLSSNDNVTYEQIWLAYIDFCAGAAAVAAGNNPNNLTEELVLSILTGYDGVAPVAERLDVDEDVAFDFIQGMLDPVWYPFYQNLILPLERAYEGASEAEKNKRAKLGTSSPDYIYLVYDEITKLYKIGRSTDPKGRLSAMNRTLSPTAPQMRLVHYFPADDAAEAERRMHAIFKHECVDREWFDLDPEHVLAIERTLYFRNDNFSFYGVGKMEEKNDSTAQ